MLRTGYWHVNSVEWICCASVLRRRNKRGETMVNDLSETEKGWEELPATKCIAGVSPRSHERKGITQSCQLTTHISTQCTHRVEANHAWFQCGLMPPDLTHFTPLHC